MNDLTIILALQIKLILWRLYLLYDENDKVAVPNIQQNVFKAHKVKKFYFKSYFGKI